MNWREMPPLAALRAFHAFVETGNVTAAGDMIGVSHAAISQQLRALEAHVGVALLDRTGRAMRLTPDGELLAQGCTEGFATISRAVGLITGAEAARPLHISPTPTFAAAWLMPRLAEFRTAHPDVNILLNPTSDLVQPATGGVDLTIRYGTGGWPGVEDTPLIESPMVIVAAPALIKGRDRSTPRALSQLPWLEEIGITESTSWLRNRGIAEGVQGPLTQVPGNLLIDGARDGQGLAVTVRLFVEADIRAGRLVVLEEEDQQGAGYHLVTRPGVQRPPLRAFVKWIRRAARNLT